MLNGLITSLIVAWFLTLFNIDDMVLNVLQPLLQIKLTDAHYYMLFGVIGLIGGLFNKL